MGSKGLRGKQKLRQLSGKSIRACQSDTTLNTHTQIHSQIYQLAHTHTHTEGEKDAKRSTETTTRKKERGERVWKSVENASQGAVFAICVRRDVKIHCQLQKQQ